MNNEHNNINIVFSADDNYVKYLAVAIKSLINNSCLSNNYTIFILNNGLSEENKLKLQNLETENVFIKFTDMSQYLSSIDNDLFYLTLHFSVAVYYRLFITEIFKDLDKVVYCDCDVIFNSDIAKIFEIDLGTNYVGAVKDYNVRKENTRKDHYYTNILHLKNIDNYFNSGVLVYNLNELKKIHFTQICLNTLKKIAKPRYVDQDVLNVACEDKVLFLDFKWNVQNHILFNQNSIFDYLTEEEKANVCESFKTPQILHFSSCIKPWQEPQIYNADYFWRYARKTDFYEEIIYSNLEQRIKAYTQKSTLYTNFFQRLFSIKNIECNKQKYKLITILGIKIKKLRKDL